MFGILLSKSTLEVNRMWAVSTFLWCCLGIFKLKFSGPSLERLRIGNRRPFNSPALGLQPLTISLLCGQRYFRHWQSPLPLWIGKWYPGQWLPTWPFLMACVYLKNPGLKRGTVPWACGHNPTRAFPVGRRNDWMNKWMNERLVTAWPALALHPVAWRQDARYSLPGF